MTPSEVVDAYYASWTDPAKPFDEAQLRKVLAPDLDVAGQRVGADGFYSRSPPCLRGTEIVHFAAARGAGQPGGGALRLRARLVNFRVGGADGDVGRRRLAARHAGVASTWPAAHDMI